MTTEETFKVGDIVRPNEFFKQIYGADHPWVGHSFRIINTNPADKTRPFLTERLVPIHNHHATNTYNLQPVWLEKIA